MSLMSKCLDGKYGPPEGLRGNETVYLSPDKLADPGSGMRPEVRFQEIRPSANPFTISHTR